MRWLLEENNHCRGTDRSVLPGEGQRSGLTIDSERRDVVGPLVARVKVISGRIDIESARIIAPCPLFSGKGEGSRRGADGEPGNAIV